MRLASIGCRRASIPNMRNRQRRPVGAPQLNVRSSSFPRRWGRAGRKIRRLRSIGRAVDRPSAEALGERAQEKGRNVLGGHRGSLGARGRNSEWNAAIDRWLTSVPRSTNARCTSPPAARPRGYVSFAQIADIGVEPRSGRSLPALRATAMARARSDSERRHGLGMLKRRAGPGGCEPNWPLD